MTEPRQEAADPASARLLTAAAQPSHSTHATCPPEPSANDPSLSLSPHLPDHSGAPVPSVGTDNDDDVQDGALYPEDDNDSTFGSSLIGSDTQTLASYITDYRYENGRQYHAFRDGEYWVINRSSPIAGGLTRLTDERDQTTTSRTSCKIWPITCTS